MISGPYLDKFKERIDAVCSIGVVSVCACVSLADRWSPAVQTRLPKPSSNPTLTLFSIRYIYIWIFTYSGHLRASPVWFFRSRRLSDKPFFSWTVAKATMAHAKLALSPGSRLQSQSQTLWFYFIVYRWHQPQVSILSPGVDYNIYI